MDRRDSFDLWDEFHKELKIFLRRIRRIGGYRHRKYKGSIKSEDLGKTSK